MKQPQTPKVGQLEVAEVPMPRPGEGQALLKTRAGALLRLREELTIYGMFASGGHPAVSRYSAVENWQVPAGSQAQGHLNTKSLVHHRRPFEQVQEGFCLLEDEPDTTMRIHVAFA